MFSFRCLPTYLPVKSYITCTFNKGYCFVSFFVTGLVPFSTLYNVSYTKKYASSVHFSKRELWSNNVLYVIFKSTKVYGQNVYGHLIITSICGSLPNCSYEIGINQPLLKSE